MHRTIDVDMEVKTKNIETALNKFFKKYPSLIYWKENFEYMNENNQDFFSDEKLGNGTKNNDWCYALHLDINENSIYMAVIERKQN
jgi:hypothetical protein